MSHLSIQTLSRATAHVLATLHLGICTLVLLLVVVPYVGHGMYQYDFNPTSDHSQGPFVLDYFPFNIPSVGDAVYTFSLSLYAVVMFAFPVSLILWLGTICYSHRYTRRSSPGMLLAGALVLACTVLIWTAPSTNILRWLVYD